LLLGARVTTPFDLVTEKLKLVRCRGERCSARCPSHEDRRPSLSIQVNRQGDVLLHCHAGCPLDAILASLGLDKKDLFASSAPSKRNEVARYEYRYPDGRPAFEIRRYEPKSFRAFRPDGHAGAVVRPPLYHAAEVEAARIAGDPIFVCEGEKDADAVTAEGFIATTNPFGARAWHPHHTEALAGAADIIVVQDRNGPGRARGEFLVGQLGRVCGRVRLLEPLVGDDVSDHLAAGHTVAELVPVDLTVPYASTLAARARVESALGGLDLDFATRKVLLALARSCDASYVVWDRNQLELAALVAPCSERTIRNGLRKARALGLVKTTNPVRLKPGAGGIRLRYDLTPLPVRAGVEIGANAGNLTERHVSREIEPDGQRQETSRNGTTVPRSKHYVVEELTSNLEKPGERLLEKQGSVQKFSTTARDPLTREPLPLGPDISDDEVGAWRRLRDYERDRSDALEEDMLRLAVAAAAAFYGGAAS
jgi:hypothetical protein